MGGASGGGRDWPGEDPQEGDYSNSANAAEEAAKKKKDAEAAKKTAEGAARGNYVGDTWTIEPTQGTPLNPVGDGTTSAQVAASPAADNTKTTGTTLAPLPGSAVATNPQTSPIPPSPVGGLPPAPAAPPPAQTQVTTSPTTQPQATSAPNIPAATTPATPGKVGLGGKVEHKDKQDLEPSTVNPFILTSKTVIGQIFEAIFKSLLVWPWQIAFEVGLRILTEALSKPYGMLLTTVGATGKLFATALQIATLGKLDMSTLHGLSNKALATGKKYDGTLPLLYQPLVGMFQKLTGQRDAAAANLSRFEAENNFKNSIFLTPLRIIPLSVVYNSAAVLGNALAGLGNFAMSGTNNSLGVILGALGQDQRAAARYKAADSNNANIRHYGNASVGGLVHMLTNPFSAMLAPPPQSAGGAAAKQAAYSQLEQVSSWWGPGNVGRWLSDTYNRGTIANNPSIKQESYFEKQQQKIADIQKALKTAGVDPKMIDAETQKIADGKYSMKEMDNYLGAIQSAAAAASSVPVDQTALDTIRKNNLKKPRGFMSTRGVLDAVSAPSMWIPVTAVLVSVAPVVLAAVAALLPAGMLLGPIIVGALALPVLGAKKLSTAIDNKNKATQSQSQGPSASLHTDNASGVAARLTQNQNQNQMPGLAHAATVRSTVSQFALSRQQRLSIENMSLRRLSGVSDSVRSGFSMTAMRNMVCAQGRGFFKTLATNFQSPSVTATLESSHRRVDTH